MLQPGDAGLISTLNIAFLVGGLIGVLAPGLVILLFYFGFGFIGAFATSPASTPLPALANLAPALFVFLLLTMLKATYDSTLMIWVVVTALVALLFTFFWQLMPSLDVLFMCISGAMACSVSEFWLYVLYFLLTVWLGIGLLIVLYASRNYMAGYWQREYYMTNERGYQTLVGAADAYDPEYDPDDHSDDDEIAATKAGGDGPRRVEDSDPEDEDDSNEDAAPGDGAAGDDTAAEKKDS
jgi:hypothetical protein